MGNVVSFTSANQTLDANVETRLQVQAGATKNFYVREVVISGDGISATEEKMDVLLQHQDADGTPGSTITGILFDKDGEAVTCTAKEAYTVEPGNKTTLLAAKVHPQGGLFWRPPAPLKIQNGKAFGVSIAHADTADVDITITGEEF